jgi:hypothetical protein
MRAALEARLVAQAAEGAAEAGRLRRRLVFQRLLRRLSDDDRWVLKGGYLLETRLAAGARTTRDLDLASGQAIELGQLRDALEAVLSRDPDGDFFRFGIAGSAALRQDEAGLGGWRFNLDARLAGRTFDRVRVDVVARVAETAGGTEVVEVAAPITGMALSPARVVAVDVAQHAAEKFHALCRTYAGDQPSTRVKDLVDVVLLAEAGLLPDPRLGDRLRAVFASRDGREPPATLPQPPASWARDYGVLVADLRVASDTVETARALASRLYTQALS